MSSKKYVYDIHLCDINMLCEVCIQTLHGNKDLIWCNTQVRNFKHHDSSTILEQNAKERCLICMAVAQLLKTNKNVASNRLLLKTYLRKPGKDPGQISRFFLDFQLDGGRFCTFVFTERKLKNPLRFMTSSNTAADDVLDLTQKWIERCRCADGWHEPGLKWYPKRLLDLEELRRASGSVNQARVWLIESSKFFQETMTIGATCVYTHSNHRYVTLSHCWGKPREGDDPLKLTDLTMERFSNEGIEVQELPNTFRDAVLFASKLDQVRFIWIDSLCIRQALKGDTYNEEEQLRDFLEQSRFMDKVYQKAYLNMSATASTDGHGGLFRERSPEHVQEDVVDLYGPKSDGNSHEYDLTRCTITNSSTWIELVDQAPINKRGWVLQERLLAPRVLHFCHNQVAWECAEFDDAEIFPEPMTALNTDRKGAPHGRTKDFTINAGMNSRNTRLDGRLDPDLGMQDVYVFELWRMVVERYSRTDLSYPSDVFMALAGIARHFHRHLFSKGTECHYVAGLWSRNLESQLLWHVNEDYQIERFHNPAKRFPDRAPSFSWAAVDTPYGITCGDITDYGLAPNKNNDHTSDHVDTDMQNNVRGWTEITSTETLKLTESSIEYQDSAVPSSTPDPELFFKVLDYDITLLDTENPFGMIKEGQMLLQPQYLHRIELALLPKHRKITYCWYLKPRTMLETRKRWEFTNSYFDAPDSDVDMFEEDAELYVMPAANGPRTSCYSDQTLYCLLLKYEGLRLFPRMQGNQRKVHQGMYQTFKRVGLSKIQSFRAEQVWQVLEGKETTEIICLV